MRFSKPLFFSFLFLIIIIILFMIRPLLYNYENNVVKEIGKVDTFATIDFVVTTKNNSEFIVGTRGEVWLFNASDNKIKITKNIFPFFDSEGDCFAKTLSDNSFYITNLRNGLLVNPDLEFIRNDKFPNMEIRRSGISPMGDIALFSSSHAGSSSGFNLVELPSKKIILNHRDEYYIGLEKAQDKLYLFSFVYSHLIKGLSSDRRNHSENKILIRDSPDWKIIKEIPVNALVHPDCVLYLKTIQNHQELWIFGTSDGRLIFLDYPSFTLQSEVKLTPHMISAMCKIDDRTIAVGDGNGQTYLVDVRSQSINKFPTIEYASGIHAMAYQSSSRVLSVGLGSEVRFWKLKDAAFAD